MVFSSLIFIFAFLGLVLAIYYLMRPLPIIYRNVWLFLVSIFFYAWGEPKFFIVMIGSIFINYIWGLLVDKYRESGGIKVLLGAAVGSNLLILFIFKYLNFSVEILNSFVGDIFTVPGILLPIGVSFFTFQAISYVIDVYRKDGEVQKNPLNVGLYIAFFPQLVAGPIVRYDTVAKQLADRRENMEYFAVGIERFMIGFCKKILLANTFGAIADPAFNDAWKGFSLGTDYAWVAAVAYSLQILFDFSGYSDMAIGLGKMFGFHFLENFRYPYASISITDFWRRWHISLGSWFRDYVYIPMGGSRVRTGRLICNLFIVWMLTGIWHGANWTFVLWGLFYFVLLTFEKLTKLPARLKTGWMRFGYRVLTLLSVLLGWVLFRCESVGTVLRYVKTMFGLSQSGLHDARASFHLKEYWIFWVTAILLCIPVPRRMTDWLAANEKAGSVLAVLKPVILTGLFIVGVSYLILSDYNPFIYFNF